RDDGTARVRGCSQAEPRASVQLAGLSRCFRARSRAELWLRVFTRARASGAHAMGYRGHRRRVLWRDLLRQLHDVGHPVSARIAGGSRVAAARDKPSAADTGDGGYREARGEGRQPHDQGADPRRAGKSAGGWDLGFDGGAARGGGWNRDDSAEATVRGGVVVAGYLASRIAASTSASISHRTTASVSRSVAPPAAKRG